MDQYYDDENFGIHDPSMEPAGPDEMQITMNPEVIMPDDQQHYTPPVQETGTGRKVGLVNDMLDLASSATTGEADIMLQAVEKFSKSQMVRFFDISVIGPLLLYYAYKGKLNPIERTVLGLIGLGTVAYNARNFLGNRQILSSPAVVAIKEELKERI